MEKDNIIAIDLAKSVFQVCKVSPRGKIIYNREVSRKRLKELLVKETKSLVAMEACATAHYWARYAERAGHQVKVIDARIVMGFQTKQKTDKNDAIAIATAAPLEHIQSVRIQSVEEQAMQSTERARSLALTHVVAQSNQIRGLLLEFGIVIPQGINSLRRNLPMILEDAENDLPDSFRQIVMSLWEHLEVQIEHADAITSSLKGTIESNQVCQKLMKLEGVGPIGALGLSLRLGKGEHYSNGRNAAASIGLTPKQHSSGGKEHIGHISKQCADKRLRATLYQGALSVVSLVVNRPPKTHKEQWLKALIARRGKKVAAIALANKTVRTAFAILKSDSEYEPEVIV